MGRHPHPDGGVSLPLERVRAALDNVLRVIFDVARTRGKVQEWYAGVDDPQAMHAAQSLGAVMRKIDFLTRPGDLPAMLQTTMAGFDAGVLAELTRRVGSVPGHAGGASAERPSRALRQLVAHPAVVSRLLRLDRSIVRRLQRPERERWMKWYSTLRNRARSALR